MADPHFRPHMDTLDIVSVILYRTGLTLAGPALLLWIYLPDQPTCLLWLAALLCASNLHIYSKQIRTVLQWATWGGLFIALCSAELAGLGGALVTLGGLGFKEYHCFRIPLLQFQPVWVAVLWISTALEYTWLSAITTLVAAVLFMVLAVAKWRMPLDYDIGDKSKYEL